MENIIDLAQRRAQKLDTILDVALTDEISFQDFMDWTDTNLGNISNKNIMETTEKLNKDPENIELLFKLATYIPCKNDIEVNENFKIYKKIMQLDPTNVRALSELGAIYHNFLDNNKMAETCYLRCLRMEPGKSKSYITLGEFYFEFKKVNESIEIYRKGIEITNEVRLFYNLGFIFFSLKEYDKSLKIFQYVRDNLQKSDPTFSSDYVSVSLGIYDCYHSLKQPFHSRKELESLKNNPDPKIQKYLKSDLAIRGWAFKYDKV